MVPMGKFGIALVGLGRSGHFHLTSIESFPDVAQLQWVVDVDADRASKIASRMGCRAVFTVKPISHTVSEVQEAVDLALRYRLPVVCGYQRRYDRKFALAS